MRTKSESKPNLMRGVWFTTLSKGNIVREHRASGLLGAH